MFGQFTPTAPVVEADDYYREDEEERSPGQSNLFSNQSHAQRALTPVAPGHIGTQASQDNNGASPQLSAAQGNQSFTPFNTIGRGFSGQRGNFTRSGSRGRGRPL